jgi:hypothetical protein
MRPAAPDSVISTFSGLVAIEAPHFTAGIVIDCDRVKKAPLWRWDSTPSAFAVARLMTSSNLGDQ